MRRFQRSANDSSWKFNSDIVLAAGTDKQQLTARLFVTEPELANEAHPDAFSLEHMVKCCASCWQWNSHCLKPGSQAVLCALARFLM